MQTQREKQTERGRQRDRDRDSQIALSFDCSDVSLGAPAPQLLSPLILGDDVLSDATIHRMRPARTTGGFELTATSV